MIVSEIMVSHPKVVWANQRVAEAAQVMKDTQQSLPGACSRCGSLKADFVLVTED